MENYNWIDQRLHLLCQTIAKVNRSLVPKQEDDSHTNLFFDPLGARILGRWFDSNNHHFALCLNLESLSFTLLNAKYESVFEQVANGLTTAEIEKALSEKLTQVGIEADQLFTPLPFDIPPYDFINATIESLPTEYLKDWIHFRTLANIAGNNLLGHIQMPGEVRIWPHHFDTGFYVTLPQGMGVGFGLAIEDELVGAPYFYVAAYPKEGSIKYSLLPEIEIGNWMNTKSWKGAVLSLEDIIELDLTNQATKVSQFTL
ncbi:MAG: hypothetical protein AAF705_08320, partial [Bacteroidota bacterium]